MHDDLLTLIRERINSMTGAGKAIAEYISEHCFEASLLSISELSERCDVGPSTVHRFCIGMGSEGFRDFRRRLADSVKRHGLTMESEYEYPIPDDPTGEMIARLGNGMHKSVNEALRLWSGDKLSKALDALRNAEHIVIFGMGSSMNAALVAYQRFMRATPKALCPQTYESQLQMARRMLPGDVAVLLPEEKLLQHAMELGRICSKSSAFTIGVACMADTPLAALCDLYLPVSCHDEAAQVKGIALRCAQDICIEIMCSAYEYRYASEDCLAVYSGMKTR